MLLGSQQFQAALPLRNRLSFRDRIPFLKGDGTSRISREALVFLRRNTTIFASRFSRNHRASQSCAAT